MDPLDVLVEAQLRDWERRVRDGTAPAAPVATVSAEGLDAILWKEILALHEVAASLDPSAREAALARARDRETQLWVLLESTGRPRAAAQLQATLAARRR